MALNNKHNIAEGEMLDAIHECSHAFVARLFVNLFTIECITLHPEIYNKQIITAGWVAGINFKRKRSWVAQKIMNNIKIKSFLTSNKRRYFISHRLVLILFASLIGQTIHVYGIEHLMNYSLDIEELEGLYYKGCEGDLEMFKEQRLNCLNRVIEDLNSYYWGIFKTLVLYFTINQSEIWNGVLRLSELLISKDDRTLLKEEINEFFINGGYDKLIANIKSDIINKSFNKYFKEKIA